MGRRFAIGAWEELCTLGMGRRFAIGAWEELCTLGMVTTLCYWGMGTDELRTPDCRLPFPRNPAHRFPEDLRPIVPRPRGPSVLFAYEGLPPDDLRSSSPQRALLACGSVALLRSSSPQTTLVAFGPGSPVRYPAYRLTGLPVLSFLYIDIYSTWV